MQPTTYQMIQSIKGPRGNVNEWILRQRKAKNQLCHRRDKQGQWNKERLYCALNTVTASSVVHPTETVLTIETENIV